MNISYASANAAANAIGALCDVGGAGKLIIYDGSQPANADTAVSTQSPLATFTLGATAFGAASNGVKTANSIGAVTAGNSGTAAWFRVTNYNGASVLWDGTVGATGGTEDLILSSTTITAGGSVSITSWTYTQPRA
jgi:hypothetical protein